MNAVTYGHLLAATDRHLDAATAARDRHSDVVGIMQHLHRLATVMVRHLDIVTAEDVITAASASPWQSAATEIREALSLAADRIGEAAGHALAAQTASPSSRPFPELDSAEHLGRAAESLAAALDLIRTHQVRGPDGTIEDRSEWARTLRTPAVGIAIAREMTARSYRIAHWLAWRDEPSEGLPRSGLDAAHDCIRAASKAASRLDSSDIDLAGGQTVLHQLPLKPARIAPHSGELPADLTAGIAASAERLRVIAFTMPELKRNSSTLSARVWLRTSWAAAIISDLCAGTLHSFDGPDTTPHEEHTQLRQAVSALTYARDAWRQAAELWQFVTTDTGTEVSSATIEAQDMVLRLGRLTHANPAWTPRVRDQAPRPDLAELVSDPAARASVLSAVHHAVDAVAKMARYDLLAITDFGAARRFYMREVLLWGHQTKHRGRNYLRAPPDRVGLLLDLYRVTATTSLQAAETLDALALGTGASSQTLALARRLAPLPVLSGDPSLDLASLNERIQHFARSRRALTPEAPRAATPDKPDPQPQPPPQGRPTSPSVTQAALRFGPFENELRSSGIDDPLLRARAAAIDRAGAGILRQAGLNEDLTIANPRARRRPRTASQLAATDEPAVAQPSTGPTRHSRPTTSAHLSRSNHRPQRP